MKILGVDSTATAASAAVYADGKLLAVEFSNTGLTHSQTLLPMIDNVLKSARISVNDIDYFAFYCLETDVVCLVPFDENFPSSSLSIRLDTYEGTRTSTMRFVSDFQISKFVCS